MLNRWQKQPTAVYNEVSAAKVLNVVLSINARTQEALLFSCKR
jgi:hypothetical protein